MFQPFVLWLWNLAVSCSSGVAGVACMAVAFGQACNASRLPRMSQVATVGFQSLATWRIIGFFLPGERKASG